MQTWWGCCGFENLSDKPDQVECPSAATDPCHPWLSHSLTRFRDVSLILLFMNIVFALFLDFTACGLCCHPDRVPLESVQQEEEVAYMSLVSTYTSQT
jgi:hypothetical protein